MRRSRPARRPDFVRLAAGIVSRTRVELFGMLAYLRLLPRLLAPSGGGRDG